jgi:hypothetical protein
MCDKLTFTGIDATKRAAIVARAANAKIEISGDAGTTKIQTPLGEADVEYSYDATVQTLTLQAVKLPALVRCSKAQSILNKLVNG